MALTPKLEYKPLLRPGFHPLSLQELEALCVTRFPKSTTRRRIFEGLTQVIGSLHGIGLNAEVWIDGSFLTEKENPNDSDVVVKVHAAFFENGTIAQQDAIQRIATDLKTSHKCDCYVLFHYDPGDPRANESEWMNAYWIRQFGFSRGNEMKGMALYSIQEAP